MGDQAPLWRIWLVAFASSAAATTALSALSGSINVLDGVITGLLLSTPVTGFVWVSRRGTSKNTKP